MKTLKTEVVDLSELMSHNNIDLEEAKSMIDFNGNMCHIYDVEEYLDVELDIDGLDDTTLVNLWG